jgi:acyl-CoA reductase-like NAD-dependent aldehyde dehydrogenase
MGADPQPLWALVPPAHRARYLRRAARAVLDDLDGLARLLAEESGQPRTEATLAELLPSVGGLHGLADVGP